VAEGSQAGHMEDVALQLDEPLGPDGIVHCCVYYHLDHLLIMIIE
jgi:hypothetical protein